MKPGKRAAQLFVLFLPAFVLCAALAAQKPSKKDAKANDDNETKQDQAINDNRPAAVWSNPGDPSTLNLFYGAGGKEHAPDINGKFTFVKEDTNGTSPKFDVQDEHGVGWKVKLGQEPQAETAATRLLWAAGYFVDEDYYLANFKVQGLTKLHRGENMISEDGTIHGARLERRLKNVKKMGNWDWFHNQCGPEKAFNGLRVMMALVNNWDLKDINNTIEEVDGQRRCVVTDVGATLGKTGNSFTRSKSSETDFANSDFVAKVNGGYVDFVMHSRPFILARVNVPNDIKRGKMEDIAKHIPLADARALGKRLALLSEDQIRDSFRAAGYTLEEVNGYTKAVQSRIAELNAL